MISEIFSGMMVHFDFDVEIKREVKLPVFRLMFVDLKGVVRFLCNNQFSMSNHLNIENSGKQSIRCTIPEFPLPKGNYTIQLSCFSREGVEDDVEAAIEFNVAGGDFFKTGKEQVLKEGVLVKNTFRLMQ